MISYSTTTSSIKEKEKEEQRLDKDFTIFQYKLLGKGGFGHLFLGRSIHENSFIAIKVEEQSPRSRLAWEYQIIKELSDGEGIPKVYRLHRGKKHNYLIMQLLGKSLDKVFVDMKKKFSIKTVCMIAYQMVQRIEFVHSKGYIHRDVKPGNFLLGKNLDRKKILFI